MGKLFHFRLKNGDNFHALCNYIQNLQRLQGYIYTQIFHTSRILPPNSAILLISLFSSLFVAKIKNKLTCKFSIENWPMHILYVPAGLSFKKSYSVLQKGINSSFHFVNSIYVLKLVSWGKRACIYRYTPATLGTCVVMTC